MAVSKIELATGDVLIDLTTDTVTPETLAEGITAHGANGELIVGTMKATEDLNAVLVEQESLITELKETLQGKTTGGDDSPGTEVQWLTREVTEYSNQTLTHLGSYALSGTQVTSLNLPALTTISAYSFYNCTTLEDVNFQCLTEIPTNGFREYGGVVRADFSVLRKIGSNGFYKCTKLETLIIRTDSVCTVVSGTVWTGTPILAGTGFIYVPKALIEDYKVATNWSALATQFRAIEDYPEITGGEA
jgi:hypothetical protein